MVYIFGEYKPTGYVNNNRAEVHVDPDSNFLGGGLAPPRKFEQSISKSYIFLLLLFFVFFLLLLLLFFKSSVTTVLVGWLAIFVS